MFLLYFHCDQMKPETFQYLTIKITLTGAKFTLLITENEAPLIFFTVDRYQCFFVCFFYQHVSNNNVIYTKLSISNQIPFTNFHLKN